MGIVIIHPHNVIETEIDETILLASLFFFIIGVISIFKGRQKQR